MKWHRIKKYFNRKRFLTNIIIYILILIGSFGFAKMVFQKDMFSAFITIMAFIGLILLFQSKKNKTF